MIGRKQSSDLQSYKSKKESSNKAKQHSVYKGLLLAMLSGVLYSAAAAIVKQMKNIHPGQLAMYRFIAIFAFSLPQAIKSQENMLGPNNLRFLIFLCGIVGATNLFFSFLAFRYLPLGEASVIIFSLPVFVTVAARIFLKEPCGIFQNITVFITVIGIIFTTKIPLKLVGNSVPYSMESIYGLLAAVGALFFCTTQIILLRKIKTTHHSILMFNFGWLAFIESTFLTAIIGNFDWPHCELQTILIIVLGVLSFAGQTLLITALQCEFAGPVSTMRAASDILFAFMWQTLFFHDIPDVFSSIGAVLVGVSVIFVGMRKWVSALLDESTNKKRFGWMLK